MCVCTSVVDSVLSRHCHSAWLLTGQNPCVRIVPYWLNGADVDFECEEASVNGIHGEFRHGVQIERSKTHKPVQTVNTHLNNTVPSQGMR